MRFESNDILRKRIGNGQFGVESAGIQPHTCQRAESNEIRLAEVFVGVRLNEGYLLR